ncbi:pilus assembly protein PilM [Clostridium sp. AM58-1XD]|uniref:pilus assembly protein PilM n=1 Tax=Clostridium sp. AM58-1XD TaxID=2292307 RepID=UPI000E4E060C|nr:pilus assembly protein PilM [Clostridium sp. AM58-1XD]RGZ00167.1 hypothetical protein DXA13_06045 [Clostridium sp. AM58-1XD]
MGTVLSISLGNKSMQIGEVSKSRSGVVVKRLIEKEIQEGLMDDGTVLNTEAVAKAVVAALKEANIKTKRVIFTIPSGKVMSREIVLPRMKDEKVIETIKSNAEEYFPIGLEDYVISYFKISNVYEEDGENEEEDHGEPEDGADKKKKKEKRKKRDKHTRVSQRLMVLAVSNSMVQSYYDVAALAHLKLLSLDYMGNSILQVITNQIGEETCLVIQMREDNTSLTVFDNAVMMLQRNINYGTADIVHTIEDTYGVSYHSAQKKLEENELFRAADSYELKNSINYFISNIERVIEYYRGRNPDMPVTNIYFVGEGSRIAGMPQTLEESIGLPVHTLSTLKRVIIRPSAAPAASEAMQFMANIGAVIEPVGFLPRALEQDIRKKLETKACRILVLLAIFMGLVIVTIPALDFFNLSFEKMDLESKLMSLQDVDEIFENYQRAEQKYSDVEAIESMVRTNNESLAGFIDVFEQLRPSSVNITSFACDNGKITFSALADSKNTVIKLITQLKTIANVYQVDVSGLSSTFDETGAETVSFSIICLLVNDDARFTEAEEDMAVEANAESAADTEETASEDVELIESEVGE